jgi:opacity protein-like surface antigen
MKNKVCGIALALFLLAASALAQSDDKRVALVIGNATYANIPSLKNPANDAADMRASLERLGFTVIGKSDADRRTMRDLIDEFFDKARGADTALFYYSGHGIQYEGENYLVPINAEVKIGADVPEECVPIARVTGRMDESGAATNIIVLDACRDNPFPSVTRGIERGLAVIAKKPSESIIVYATGENQKAEDGEGRNGIFTSALLANIERREAFEDILLAVKAQVRAATNDVQQPAVYENLTHKVFLAGAEVASGQAAAAAAPALAPPVEPTPVQGAASRSPFTPRSIGLTAGYGLSSYTDSGMVDGVFIQGIDARLEYFPAFSKLLGLSLCSGYEWESIYPKTGLTWAVVKVEYCPIGIGLCAEYAPLRFLSLDASIIPQAWIRSQIYYDWYNQVDSSAVAELQFALGMSAGLRLNFSPFFGLGSELEYNYLPSQELSEIGVKFYLVGNFAGTWN